MDSLDGKKDSKIQLFDYVKEWRWEFWVWDTEILLESQENTQNLVP